jgi:peptidoglycan/LPS O-acetylase OafA/YrhL
MTERTYFPELDGLRFLAFLLVFAFHGGLPWVEGLVSFLTLPLFIIALPFGPEACSYAVDIGPTIGKMLTRGWVGVNLFFILSGFLITTLLLREERAFGRVDLRAFWIRRILRIWPLYYLIVAITFLLIPAMNGWFGSADHISLLRRHLPWFLGFLGNWSMIVQGSVNSDQISILWSVCVEEQFYLFVPLLVALVGRRLRLPVVATLMAGAVGYRAALAATHPPQVAIVYNTFVHLDTLLSGVALAIVLDRWPPGDRARSAAKVWGWIALAGAFFLLRTHDLGQIRPVRQTWDFVAIWACGVGIIAYLTLVDGWLRRLLSDPRLVWLGRISYGLYMIHEIALHLVRPIPALPLTIALAAASYYGFERPFLRLKSRWTRVPSRPV